MGFFLFFWGSNKAGFAPQLDGEEKGMMESRIELRELKNFY